MPKATSPNGQPPQLQVTFAPMYDAFFMNFAVQAHRMGFTTQERTVPSEAAMMPYQTVWRWKKPDVEGLFLQLGPGVFTVNGAPPTYSDWDGFLPTVKEGVAGLLQVLDSYPAGRPTSFNQTLLRYIDLFDYDSIKSKPPLEFFRDVMGLKIELPGAISDLAVSGEPILPTLNVTIPLEDGAMQLTFANGTVGGRPGHIFDTTVVRNADVPLDADAVTKSFTASHEITNRSFMALTAPLHAEMEPKL